jgi:hypothetical protein
VEPKLRRFEVSRPSFQEKKDNSTLPTRNFHAFPQSRRGRILAEKQGFRLVETGRNQPLNASHLSFFGRKLIFSRVAFSLRREESRIATYRVIHRGFQVPVMDYSNSAILSAEREGYFGLRQSHSGILKSKTAQKTRRILPEVLFLAVHLTTQNESVTGDK